MLINHFLLICIVIVTPIALLFGLSRLVTFFEKKGLKSPVVFKIIGIFCLLSLLFIILFSPVFFYLPEVRIVNDTGNEKKIIIGSYSMQFKNGETVKIKGNYVVNNSSRDIYVETVRYSSFWYSSNKQYDSVEKIEPYSIYKGRIDYAFETPPKTIRIKKKEKSEKKWLRY
jgi:hypothetical protein